MGYSLDIAEVLASQLDRLAKLNPYQLAGQFANVDFWRDEVRHCLDVIDGYRARFERIRTAETSYVKEHETQRYYPEFDIGWMTPSKPWRIPDDDLKASRLQLREAFYRFLIRGYRERIIDEPLLRATADSVGLGIDLVDLRR
jgi:hypothetical protein